MRFSFCFYLIQKYQKQLIIIIKQKAIFVEMEKFKKDIESKDSKIQVKQKQILNNKKYTNE
ncbi:hypothetical protein RFI_37952 [Reticulomyxa filosa]|uniref:Uncharacterized protein n=1 Tax=Reticulomyxa filosa TaxID=46433 RepID=X6LD95_RETFI|nr:hypothetical protein RFI_37952 [Reticulomyxa filosa]|eukprot:ETN99518.1 hypothetical protein RFI_37952 [Reticulomyxa filosa]